MVLHSTNRQGPVGVSVVSTRLTYNAVLFCGPRPSRTNEVGVYDTIFQLYNEEILDLMDTTLNPEIKVRTKLDMSSWGQLFKINDVVC